MHTLYIRYCSLLFESFDDSVKEKNTQQQQQQHTPASVRFILFEKYGDFHSVWALKIV